MYRIITRSIPPSRLWELSGYTLSPSLSDVLLSQVSSNTMAMHDATALALGGWLEAHPSEASTILEHLVATYERKRAPPRLQKDSFGRVVALEHR